MSNTIEYLNPEGLAKSPAFSQVVMTPANGQHIYIGGQNSIDEDRTVIGKGDIAAQTAQALENVQTALLGCGAIFDNLIKLTIYVVQGQDVQVAYKAAQPFMSGLSHPPIVTVVFVAALGNPDFLVEIDAVAFLPA